MLLLLVDEVESTTVFASASDAYFSAPFAASVSFFYMPQVSGASASLLQEQQKHFGKS